MSTSRPFCLLDEAIQRNCRVMSQNTTAMTQSITWVRGDAGTSGSDGVMPLGWC